MAAAPEPEKLRLDKWLMVARFARTRAAAQQMCESGRLRLNGQRVTKAGRPLRIGDVLTVPFGRDVLVLKVICNAERRGSATVARNLYEIIEG